MKWRWNRKAEESQAIDGEAVTASESLANHQNCSEMAGVDGEEAPSCACLLYTSLGAGGFRKIQRIEAHELFLAVEHVHHQFPFREVGVFLFHGSSSLVAVLQIGVDGVKTLLVGLG